MKITSNTLEKITRLREKFTPITSLSFEFSKINEEYPLVFLTEETASQLIKEYEKLLEKLRNIEAIFSS